MLLCPMVAWWPARAMIEEPPERGNEGGIVPLLEKASDDAMDVLDVLPVKRDQPNPIRFTKSVRRGEGCSDG